MEMKTVGEGDLLTACTGRGGGGSGCGLFSFFASRALQTRLEKK